MTTVLESLNAALHRLFAEDERVVLIGEDVLDPYGGAFKVTRGLSSAYPERVFTTPISEATIVGLASGMALRGLRPVAEIMFGDFLTLAADQLVNHAAKFRWMYNDNVRVPIVVRTPMGGRRGYGPTHSQSLEKMFLGVPGLRVLAANTLGDPGTLLEAAIADDDPVLFVEHKLLYTRALLDASSGDLQEYLVDSSGATFTNYILRFRFSHIPHLTIATYGYNFELARQAALELLMEREIFCELVVFSQLSPFDISPLLTSLQRSHRLLTVEEGGLTLGWGAEVAARVAEADLSPMARIRRVAGLDLPIANARSLEDAILPSKDSIIRAALEIIE